MRRRTCDDAYTQECIEEMQANFHDHIKKGASTTKVTTYKGTIRTGDQPKTVERDNQPRSVRIRADDLEKHGFTAGCAGCAWYTDRMGPHRGHSQSCRERIEKAMNETEEGKARTEVAKTRKGKHTKARQDKDDDKKDETDAEKGRPRIGPRRD